MSGETRVDKTGANKNGVCVLQRTEKRCKPYSLYTHVILRKKISGHHSTEAVSVPRSIFS